MGETLIESFEQATKKYLGGMSQLTGCWQLEMHNRQAVLRITSSSTNGFDFGATCETYGLYPWASEWCGAPWESVETDVNEVCKAYFSFVRALLSPDARLCLTYRRDCLHMAVVEVRRQDEWKVFEKMRKSRLPMGEKRNVYLQNHLLPSRHPFTGLKLTEWGLYPWEGST